MINYIIGDATDPIIAHGNKIIAHGCNDLGKWGAGFSGAVSKRWHLPEQKYRAIMRYNLGEIQLIKVSADTVVANMITQRGIRGAQYGTRPLRYVALANCLDKLANRAVYTGASVHMPRIGCGLAGGNWNVVEALIEDTLGREGVPTYVYDLEES